MFGQMFRGITFGVLANLLIYVFALGEPESHISQAINAVLLRCPGHPENNTCETQLIINIHMNPSVEAKNLEKYWLLHEVYDPRRRRNMKIISPYLIAVTRSEPVVMYPLQLEKIVPEYENTMDVEDTIQNGPDQGNESDVPPNVDNEYVSDNDLRLKRSHHPVNRRNRVPFKNSGGKEHIDSTLFKDNVQGQQNIGNLGLVRIFDPSFKTSNTTTENSGRNFKYNKDKAFNQKGQLLPKMQDNFFNNNSPSKTPEELDRIYNKSPEESKSKYLPNYGTNANDKVSDDHITEKIEGNYDGQKTDSNERNLQYGMISDKYVPMDLENQQKHFPHKKNKYHTYRVAPYEETDSMNEQPFPHENKNNNYENENHYYIPERQTNNYPLEKYGEKYKSNEPYGKNGMNQFRNTRINNIENYNERTHDFTGETQLEKLNSDMNDCQQHLPYSNNLNIEGYPNNFPLQSHTDYSLYPTDLDSIANRHVQEYLKDSVMNDKHLYNTPNSQMDSKYYYPDLMQSYSDVGPDNNRRLSFSYYLKNNLYRSAGLRQLKNRRLKNRVKRNSREPEDLEGAETSQKVSDSLKMDSLKTLENNGEVPCDTCGGKNKKKEKMPGSNYCNPSLPNSLNGEDNFLKVNDEIPCDTCGGKNKKPGGKTLPGGLESQKMQGLDFKYKNTSPVDKFEESTDQIKNIHQNMPDGKCESESFRGKSLDSGEKAEKTEDSNLWHLDEIGHNLFGDTIENNIVNMEQPDLHQNDEVPCDTCGGKNKKPTEKPLFGFGSEPIEECPKLDNQFESDTYGQNKGDDIQNIGNPGRLEDTRVNQNDDIPCDTCGGKNKKPGGKTLPGGLEANEMENLFNKLDDMNSGEKNLENIPQSEEMDDVKVHHNEDIPCNDWVEKNKIPDEKMRSKLDDAVPCDTCGGKNKKPGGKPPPGGLEPKIDLKRNKDDHIPCERCKEITRCKDGTLVSQTCGCVGNPDVCACDSSKSSRSPVRYSIFKINTPVPVLTTKLRIFRKRRNTWWRIIPIINLNSMNGIYANENVSVMFTSHVDILRMEKSLSLLNSKLVIPETQDTENSRDREVNPLKHFQDNVVDGVLIDGNDKDLSMRDIESSIDDKKRHVNDAGGERIQELGPFPSSMNAFDKCPHMNKFFCLNLLDKKVPEFTIKIKIPFRENAFLIQNKHAVKIARIVTDATTKDAIQISVDLINVGLQAKDFFIYICNCEQPLGEAPHSSKSVKLLPHIGKNVNFLLPFIRGTKKKKSKFNCDVIVRSADNKNSDLTVGVVAKRTMNLQSQARCFCVSRCQCHCMDKLETYVNYNICEKMTHKSQEEAGLLYNCPPNKEKNDKCIMDLDDECDKNSCDTLCIILYTLLIIFLLFILLGLLKAILGLCCESVARCGFDTVQPRRNFACLSKKRVFCINCLFFFLYLCSFWCKCFRPKPEDLLAASTEWLCKSPQTMDSDSSAKIKCSGSSSRLFGGHDESFNEQILLSFIPVHENGLFKDEKPEDEESTAFVLEVLKESKKALNKMMIQSSSTSEDSEEIPNEVDEYIKTLMAAQIVYRKLSVPVDGLYGVPTDCQHCVRGFFVKSINKSYDFVTFHHPFCQNVDISNQLSTPGVPKYIHLDEFSRQYANKKEVFDIGDLTPMPPPGALCINNEQNDNLESTYVKLSTQNQSDGDSF